MLNQYLGCSTTELRPQPQNHSLYFFLGHTVYGSRVALNCYLPFSAS
jgi:hypothetical protein